MASERALLTHLLLLSQQIVQQLSCIFGYTFSQNVYIVEKCTVSIPTRQLWSHGFILHHHIAGDLWYVWSTQTLEFILRPLLLLVIVFDHCYQFISMFLQDIHNSYIPVPGSLDDFRTSALLAGSPAFLPPEPRASPYRRTSSRVRSSTRSTSSRVASGASSHLKKLRKSENQVEVLKRFFTTNAKPGRSVKLVISH